MYRTRNLRRILAQPAKLSLGTKTSIATSLLFLITILAIGMTALQSFRQEMLDVMIADQYTLVVRIADNLDQKLLTLQKGLTLSAGEITAADLASSDAAQRYLDNTTGLFAVVDRSIFLFTAEGIELAERPFRPNRRGSDASARAYMRDTIRTERPVISEPFMTNVGDSNMVLVATAPVLDHSGRMVAILTGSLGLTRPGMLGKIAKTMIGKTGYLYIVTADGKLIMHPDRNRLSQRAFPPGANPLFERALGGFEGTGETVESNGRESIVTYERVPSSNWIVGAVYPKDEALAAIRQLTWRLVEFLLLACVLVVASIWVLTRYLMRPLVLLTDHLKSYSGHTERIAPLSGYRGGGEIRALRSAFNRLTARLRTREDALIEAMHKYQLITDNSTDLITRHTPDGAIVFASPAATRILGTAPAELIGRSFSEFVHPDDFAAVHAAVARVAQTKTLAAIVYRARHADQHYVWLETTLQQMKDAAGEDTDRILCISRDVSERKRMEERLHDQARTDHLTALPNRVLLDERFAGGLAQTRREGSLLALLMIDIDRFKNINDNLGHGMGDALLKVVGSRLKACIRDCDTLARWGGDEFVLLLPGLSDAASAGVIAERCLAALKEPIMLREQSLHVTASIGISVALDSSAASEVLLQNADTAMYKAKARGGDCVVVYSADMSAGAQSRLSMENALFSALENDELLLHYQPLISARTGRLAGVEALLRWNHPEYGLVAPGQFIPIAEETGLIGAIGEWVLRTACSQMNAWYARGLPRLAVSVNLSSRQFRQANVAATIKQVLKETRFNPQNLELELTESLLMDDIAASTAILAELKALGITLALDDFGTGYSSLGYLKGFQLNTLKIDRSFIADVTTSEANASIVRATIGLARGLRLRTVAEGVETRAQAAFMVQQGCDVLQGYLFARPMEPSAFLSFALASHTYLLSRPASGETEKIV